MSFRLVQSAALAAAAACAFASASWPVSAQLTREATPTTKGPLKGANQLNPQPEVPSKPAGAGQFPTKGANQLNPQPEVPSKPVDAGKPLTNPAEANKALPAKKTPKSKKTERENKTTPVKPQR
jgi:hypothetical protein